MKRLAIAFAVLLSAPAYAAKPMSCESLTGLRLPDTTITTANVVPAATFNPAIVTTACRVAGSKDIIGAFYGESIKHSYFSSCSNGGRQALMEIQRFPEDYDGVLVGAPANNWTHHFAGFIWNEQALFSTPGAHMSASKLAAVQAETLRTCDVLDGVVYGVAEDPRRCKFDPASIACPAGTDGPSCLTPPQVR